MIISTLVLCTSLIGFSILWYGLIKSDHTVSLVTFVLSFLFGISIAINYAITSELSMALAFILTHVVCRLITLLIIVKKGGDFSLSYTDKLCVVIALVAFIVWYLTNALYAQICMIIMLAASVWPTTKIMLESYKAAGTWAWRWFTISAIINLYNIEVWEISSYLYPIASIGITLMLTIPSTINFNRNKVIEVGS